MIGAREGLHNSPTQHIGKGSKIAIFGPIRIATLTPKPLIFFGANENQFPPPSSFRLLFCPLLNCSSSRYCSIHATATRCVLGFRGTASCDNIGGSRSLRTLLEKLSLVRLRFVTLSASSSKDPPNIRESADAFAWGCSVFRCKMGVLIEMRLV